MSGPEEPPPPARARLHRAAAPPAPVALGAPAVVVLASLGGPLDPALDALLGAEAAAALREAQAQRAREWAAAVAPQIAFEATSPFAAAAALEGHAGPVLLVAADVPRLRARHAEQALSDLAAGADAVVAPANDATPFLVALPRTDWATLERLDAAPGGFEPLMAALAPGPGGLGMLASERRLLSPADARALAADPCAPEALVRHLRAALDVRRPVGG